MFFLRHCSDWCRHWSNKWLLHTRLLHTVCLFSALSLVDCRIKTKIINLESNCSLWSRHLPQCVKSGKNHVHKVKKWDRNQVENWCADLYDQRRANICWDRCALLLWALRPLNMGSKVPGFWTAAILGWKQQPCFKGLWGSMRCFKWEPQSWDLHQQLTVKSEKSTKRKLVLGLSLSARSWLINW